MRVFLDDERQTPEGWVRTYSAKQSIELLKTGKVEEISLDHDLGDDQPAGYTVLLWIEEEVHFRRFNPPIMSVHSASSLGGDKMRLAIAAIETMAKNQEEEKD
jgi:hypothetical protein